MKKYFILNADDFGLSAARNQAILDACQKGFLRSATICVNGDAFDDAVNNVIPKCPDLGVGVHLNIMEGKALLPDSSLTDSSGYFRPSFIKHLIRSGNKKFLKEVENEFRAQIEKGLKYIKIDHVDSHVHTHGIPAIFKIAASLAKEYGIKGIRTQYEKRYRVPGSRKNLLPSFYINRIKIFLLNSFTMLNKKGLDDFYNANDYLIGVGYTAMMDSKTIEYGLRKINKLNKDMVVEALFHPDSANQNDEYCIPFNFELRNMIKEFGFELTNFGSLDR